MSKLIFKTTIFLGVVLLLISNPKDLVGQESWEPPESKVVQNGDFISITVEKDWKYIGTSTKNQHRMFSGGSTKKVSCTCTGTGKCSPFIGSSPLGGSTSGCAGNCTKCSMVQSGVVQINDDIVKSGGYYNETLTTKVMKSGEVAPAVFSELTELKEYQSEFNKIMKLAYADLPYQNGFIDSDGNLVAPRNHSIIGLKIFGRASVVIVPKKFAMMYAGGGSSKASCSCTEGSCKLKTYSGGPLGSVKACEGNCTGTCTLTVGSSTSTNQPYEIKIVSYVF